MGPMLAIDLVATTGFVAVCVIGAVWRRREAEPGSHPPPRVEA
jgi:hypothetical protein